MRIFIRGIQLRSVNQYIDLERQDIGLKSNNNLFVLKLKYDRSFTFTIPATDKNNRIFFNSNRVDFSLMALRGNIPAVMYISDKQIEGFLKIISATQNGYNAAFFYNQTFPFDVSQKIASYLNLADSVVWGRTTTINDGGGAGLPPVSFGLYRYRLKAGEAGVPTYINYLPSVTMKRLLDECATATGISYYLDITDPTELAAKQERFERLMIKLKSANRNRIIKAEVTPSGGGFHINRPTTVYAFNLLTSRLLYFPNLGRSVHYDIYSLCFRRDCTITFQNLPTSHNWGIMKNYSFIHINNGTVVTLEANDTIIFYNRDRSNDVIAYLDAENETFYFDLQLSDVEMSYGDTYYLQDNLPDVTYVDLLTTTAYALGLSLTSDIPNNRFILSDYTLLSSPTIEIDSVAVRAENLIEIDDLDVSGVIDFDSSSWVLEHMKEKLIIGDVEEGEGNNIRLPFSEERKYAATEEVHIRDLALNGTVYDIFYSEKDVLCIYNDNTSTYLRRFNFMDGRLPSIISSGIILSLKIAQNASKFLELSATTRIIYKNKAFAIVEATNKDNITSLKLIRLD